MKFVCPRCKRKGMEKTKCASCVLMMIPIEQFRSLDTFGVKF